MPKTAFRKHVLRPIQRDQFTPRADKPEPTSSEARGYWPGSMYTADELEWMRAVERFQKRTGRKFLSHVDYQRLAVSLGYTKHHQRPSPPTPADPMNANEILTRMAAAGFRFARGTDGNVSFTPPADCGSPERQHLLAVVAWSWAWLAEHAAPFISTTEAST